jgi:predicted dehydrogenase
MRVGLVGCGYWGKNLLRNFHQLGALGLICEPSPTHQDVAKTMAPQVPLVHTFEEALESDVAALVIATPAVTHFDLVRRALLAGKDVFVEKPLALTLENGLKLANLARESDRILMVGHILEYHPACVKLVDLVREGALGKLCYLYSNRLSLGKVRREENILWSFAPHDVALMNRIVGALPETVSAFGGAYVQSDVADVTVTNLVYPGGVRGHIHVSWLHPFKEQRLVVIGTEKMASFDGVEDRLTLYDQRVEWQKGEPVPIKGEGLDVAFPKGEPLRLECQAFLNSITTRIAPLTDGRNGLEVLSVLESAQTSLQSHGQVCVVANPSRVHPLEL